MRDDMKEIRYILASGSPRRREILDRIGLKYEVILPDVSEAHGAMAPDRIVMELSKRKAEAAADMLSTAESAIESVQSKPETRYLIIAADTLVAFGDEVLGKPADREDAVRMITLIAGRTHHVYTGVTMILLDGTERITDTFCESAAVRVRPMSEDEILEYVSSGESDDKAGAYAIQGIFRKYIEGFDGDFETIKGLPGDAVAEHIRQLIPMI